MKRHILALSACLLLAGCGGGVAKLSGPDDHTGEISGTVEGWIWSQDEFEMTAQIAGDKRCKARGGIFRPQSDISGAIVTGTAVLEFGEKVIKMLRTSIPVTGKCIYPVE